MTRAVALVLIVGLLGAAGPAAAQGPIVAQFWYSFGGTNREVTEAHIKRFNESQSKYRIEGTFQATTSRPSPRSARRRRPRRRPRPFT